MAKVVSKPETVSATPSEGAGDVLRQQAEILFASELAALAEHDTGDRPVGWRLSPKAVETYVLGGRAGDLAITPKYVGSVRLVQIAIASLATDRALSCSSANRARRSRGSRSTSRRPSRATA